MADQEIGPKQNLRCIVVGSGAAGGMAGTLDQSRFEGPAAARRERMEEIHGRICINSGVRHLCPVRAGY